MPTPHTVVISGSLRIGSTSDRIALWCAEQLQEKGATTRTFTGGEIDFPFYRPGLSRTHPGLRDFLNELDRADGIVLISPTYHGTVSGLLKNALDYVNDLDGPRPFLDGRTVGCVAVGAGSQGNASTLATLRTISHALRAWPTPLGIVLPHTHSQLPADPSHRERMLAMLDQVLTHTPAPAPL